jgi:exodeoxyribonuclease VII large subunit
VARRHLDLVSRGLPDMSRRLVDLRLRVDDQGDILLRRLRRRAHEAGQKLRLDSSRLFLLSPRRTLVLARQRLEQAGQRLGQTSQRRQQEDRRHLDYLQAHLNQLNPMAILARGYAVATLLPGETVIRDASQVPLGAGVRVRVALGRLDCEVKEVGSEQGAVSKL